MREAVLQQEPDRPESYHSPSAGESKYKGAHRNVAIGALSQFVDRIEGEAEAMEMGREGADLEQQLAELETNDQIDAELAAMKKKLSDQKNDKTEKSDSKESK